MLIQNPPVEITANLLMLGTNAYPLFLYKGESQGTIFEGGVGAMGPLTLQQMGRQGIGRDFVRQVIVTHAHPDHVMAVPLFRKAFPEVTVLASEVAAATLATEKAVSFFTKIDAALTASLTEAGLIAEEHHPKPLAESQIAIDRVIKDGDTIAVDAGVSFTVLETPGHSECSLSFHDPVEKILIISDATGYYMPEQDFLWPNYFVDYGTYISSIERLATLGAEILCLSHNAVLKGAADVKSHFEAAMSATKDYHARIVSEAKAGKPVRRIAEQLGSEVYEKTQLLPLDFFQKNCGAMVKLSLKHEGMQGLLRSSQNVKRET